MLIVSLFVLHWLLAVFIQSSFHHRYAAHRMFTMPRVTERITHVLAFLVQGPSYLSPRAYAILHREHHAFSDTPRDPHSPHQFPNVWTMMWATKTRYDNYAYKRTSPEARFDGGYPEWPLLDRLSQ